MVYIKEDSEDKEDAIKQVIELAYDKVSDCKHPEIFAAAMVSETLKRKCFNDMARLMDQGLDVDEAADAADVVLLRELSDIVLLLADCVMDNKGYKSENSISNKAIELKEEYAEKLSKTLDELKDDINNTKN